MEASPGADVSKGVRRATLLLTGQGSPPEACPFPDVDGFPDSVSNTEAELEKLRSLPNARVLPTRLTPELVAEAMAQMPRPCRVVVSGPSGFNNAARGMLLSAGVTDDSITVLEA